MTGLLLINLGTPDAPETGPVRRYLRQFLSDPRVLDINPVSRKLLLELFILPTRPGKSAAAYRKIWTTRGSPLLFHSQDLAAAVKQQLGDKWHVELGMRYGNPSLQSAMQKFRDAGVDNIVVLPLYPQYSSAATGSSVEEVFRIAAKLWVTPMLTVLGAFYDDPRFIESFAKVSEPLLAEARADHVLFSFHGLPERHMTKSDDSGAHCFRSAGCCDAIGVANRNCYRAQCFATARALAVRLQLRDGTWSVSFQSRLGRTPWIKPYTDLVLPELAAAGKRRLAIFSPAFVADCLETEEELGIRAREQFLAAGGKVLTLIPSLNATPTWVQTVVDMVRGHAS